MFADDRCGCCLGLLVVALTALAVSCGKSSLAGQCQTQTQTCTAGGRTYQTCSHADGTIDYDTAGEQCTCPPGNPLQCLLCAEIVMGSCGDDPARGFSDAGTGSCTVTFAGAFSGAASCALSILYAPSAGATSVRGTSAVRTAVIAGTPYFWGGEFDVRGMPASGTFPQTSGLLGSIFVTDESPGMLPNWEATINDGSPLGQATLQISSVGPGLETDGQVLYPAAHGTWSAILVDHRSQSAPLPDETVLITF